MPFCCYLALFTDLSISGHSFKTLYCVTFWNLTYIGLKFPITHIDFNTYCHPDPLNTSVLHVYRFLKFAGSELYKTFSRPSTREYDSISICFPSVIKKLHIICFPHHQSNLPFK